MSAKEALTLRVSAPDRYSEESLHLSNKQRLDVDGFEAVQDANTP